MTQSYERVEERYRIFQAILYFASDRGHRALPANKFNLCACLVLAYFEYLTGREVENAKMRIRSPLANFECQANDIIDEALKENSEKGDTYFRQVMKELTEYKFRQSGPYHGMVNELDDLVGLYSRPMDDDAWFISVKFVSEVEKDTLPMLGPAILEPVRKLAEISKKYFDAVLEARS